MYIGCNYKPTDIMEHVILSGEILTATVAQKALRTLDKANRVSNACSYVYMDESRAGQNTNSLDTADQRSSADSRQQTLGA